MAAADELFGWDACTFDLYSPAERKLSTVLYMDTIKGKRVDVSPQCKGTDPSPQTRQVIERGAQLVLRPAAEFADGSKPFGDKSRPSASLMFAPIRQDSNVIGILSIQSYKPDAYNEDDLVTLQALADHCAGALERIRAEQEVLRLNAELERRVGERTTQLEAINKELEAFCYSVSHDLRAPLRSIRGFSEVLLERYSPQLDDRAREFLQRSCQSALHMDRLIDDLLQLSRVSSADMQRQTVNLSTLAQGLAAELRKTDPSRPVEFAIASDLQAKGDERLLGIALDNLVRNAWKFTSKLPHAKIEFGTTNGAQPAFFVRDNGVGFNERYAGRIFGVFQRLHADSDFPGTGVGLATVQRIINRHGGRVWATGAVNKGATFYFSLPEWENI